MDYEAIAGRMAEAVPDLPDAGKYDLWDQARDTWVCALKYFVSPRLKAMLFPESVFASGGSGLPFFPPAPVDEKMTVSVRAPEATGFPEGWWTDFGNAAVGTSLGKEYADVKKAQATVDSKNKELSPEGSKGMAMISKWYRTVFQSLFKPFAEEYAALKPEETEQVKGAYIHVLTSDRFLEGTLALLVSGNWGHQEWELYHHFLKLRILGADDGELQGVMDCFAGKGLMLPTMTLENLDQYRAFYKEGKVYDGNFNGETARLISFYSGSQDYPMGLPMQIAMKQYSQGIFHKLLQEELGGYGR